MEIELIKALSESELLRIERGFLYHGYTRYGDIHEYHGLKETFFCLVLVAPPLSETAVNITKGIGMNTS